MKDDATLLLLARKVARRLLGLDVRSIGRSTFEHALSRRIDALSVTEQRYHDILLIDNDEQHRFVPGLLISESWFFREEKPVQVALSEFDKKAPIRVLSTPSARGEELISAYVYCREQSIPVQPGSFEGYDLSQSAIDQSHAFLYGAYSFRNGNDARRIQFFESEGAAFTLRHAHRPYLQTIQADLLHANWRPRNAQYDIILCRNFFIYLRPERQHAFVQKLKSLLAPNGKLIMGTAEGALLKDPQLIPHPSMPCVFSYSESAFEAPILPSVYIKPMLKPESSSVKKLTTIHSNIVSPASKPKALPTNSSHQHIDDLIRAGQTTEAFSLCLEALETESSSDELHVTVGKIHMMEGDEQEAIEWFQAALKINPNNRQARIHLETLEAL